MTTAGNATADAVAAILRDGLRHIEGRGPLVNEATTLEVLIRPTLEQLGYPATHRIPEYGASRNRLDEACFLNGVVGPSPGHAAVIVEAKQYATDFDKSAGRYDSPDRQIQRYLKQHQASGPDTLGVLTDGAKWRIYRRAGHAANPDVEFLVEHNFQQLARADPLAPDGLAPAVREWLQDLVERLARASIAYRTIPRRIAAGPVNLADAFFDAIGDNFTPPQLLRGLLNEPDTVVQDRLADDASLLGIRKDAHDQDWEAYAYSRGIPVKADTDRPTPEARRVVIAAVQFKYRPDRRLTRTDAALCARAFASADRSGAAVVFAYAAAPDGTREARVAVAAGGQVNMTAAFEPSLLAPSARAALARLLQLLHHPGDGVTADSLLTPLEAAPLRQQFYREIAQWTGRMQQGQSRQQRQAVLRHLVRVMFAWILKEENIIPPELFERAFIAAAADPRAYHRAVIRFLFHHRLNVPTEQRDEHPAPAVNDAMEQTPFLNGSLFAEHDDDDELDIAPEAYWSTDKDEPGLFTILSRYHWTMDEHRPGESEQTLDPELLSNLFERLITPTEEGTAPPLRQPQGTYYTPADVADEMVKDALAAAVRGSAPSRVSDAQLLDLFGSGDEPLPSLCPAQRRKLTQRIRELRVFDPAVGSGEFLLSTLLALQRALGRLEPDAAHPAAADIIKRQLAGQDINPLAVQIARLRLFIAITADHRKRNSAPPPPENHLYENEPLPNLEARIVCADTLQTIASPDWRPDRPGQLDTADPEFIAALTAVAENRARWFDAHTEDGKQELLRQDSALRDRLKLLIRQQGELASPELAGFANAPLFNIDPTPPARTDARLLFYENPWRGFDIVIGNPPYTDLHRAARKGLSDNKLYQTTNVNDTYTLFCETGLALANSDGGVVTMVVPLSIAFGQRQRSVRQVFEARCRKISLRHYDNRPDTTFSASPTVQHQENRQRATIITSVLGNGTPAIKSTGLQRWPAAERAECLAQRAGTPLIQLSGGVDNRVARQWLRIPTPEVAAMVKAITAQSQTVIGCAYKAGDADADSGEALAFPQTAYQFISVVPAGTISPRRETIIRFKDKDILRLVMATLNGHVGYAWWWMVGDGFDMKPVADHGTLTIPNIWSKNPNPAIALGQRLIDAMPECIVETPNRGIVWRNVNFHRKPELIAELDRLHLAALGFTGQAQDTLLRHLRIMRSSSSWNYGG